MPTTERTVVTRLVANNDAYDRAMRRSAGETRNLAQAGGVASKQIGETSTALRASSEDLRTVGTAAGIAGVAVAAGIGFAVKTAMDFEQQMSNLAAVTGATGDEMGVLRQQALDLGQATVFSASEAAQAQQELAKAGISTADILSGGLQGALDLAAAGNIGLAQAAELSANAMTTFKLSGADVPRIADALAAGANKSAADVDDMGIALQQAGLVADQTGLTMEETVGTLSLFAQAGLRGSDAGTSLKTALLRLNPTTDEARTLMEQLGLDFYDAEGNFIGLEAAAGLLQDRLGGLTQEQRNQALATLFGQDAIRSGTILYEAGADGVAKWTGAVSDSGYAAELARQKTDNLAGDLEQLKGSFETALIETGSEATTVLRELTQGATNLVTGFTAMPGPISASATGVAALSAGGLLAVGAVGTLIPKVREVKEALDKMGGSAQWVSSNMGNIAKVAGAATAAVTILSLVMSSSAKNTSDAADANRKFLDTLPKGNDLASQQQAVRLLQDELGRLGDAYKEYGNRAQRFAIDAKETFNPFDDNKLDRTREQVKDLQKAQEELLRTSTHLEEVSNGVANALGVTAEEAERLVLASNVDFDNLPFQEAVGAVKAYEAGLRNGTAASQDMDSALEGTADVTKSTAEQFDELVKAIDAYLKLVFGSESAQDDFQQGLNDLGDAAKKVREEGQGAFDGTSDAAIAFREQMRGIVTDGASVIESWINQGIQGDELNTRIFLLGQAFRQQAIDAGVPIPIVDDYLGRLYNIPTEKKTAITADASQAFPVFDSVMAAIGKIPLNTTVTINGKTGVWRGPGLDISGGQPGGNWWAGADGDPSTPWPQADGGILQFASGGMENHVAQIAPAGAMRLWAEPETGGEAYIPLGSSKRARSLAIWKQTGRMLGVPAPVPAMSGGGVSYDQSNRSRSLVVNVKVDGGRDESGLGRRIARDVARELQRIEGSVA